MGEYRCDASNGIPPSASQMFKIQVHCESFIVLWHFGSIEKRPSLILIHSHTAFAVSPLIRIHRQMLGGYNGSSTSMECTVEAYPMGVYYWERHDGKDLQNETGKYAVTQKAYDTYKTTMRLHITITEQADFGAYYCISKNEKGLTKGGITLFGKEIWICSGGEKLLSSTVSFQERDPNSNLPPPMIGGFRPTVIGEEPPPFIGEHD